MVKSDKIWSSQNFLELMTGKCYVLPLYSLENLQEILMENGVFITSFPLIEIEAIVKNNIDVVLVELNMFNENDEIESEYLWFETPDNFAELLENYGNEV